MRKKEKILIAVLALIAVIMLVSIAVGKREENPTGGNTSGGGNTNQSGQTSEIKIDSINNVEEMKTATDKVYEKVGKPYTDLKTIEIDVNDEIKLGTYTGLASNKDIEAVVVSEPENATEAYSMIMVKVAEVGDVETLKQWILDHVNVKRWVWFEAEKVYITNFNNTIFAVVGNEYIAKEVYNGFKEIVNGEIGKELVRTTADDPEEQVDAE